MENIEKNYASKTFRECVYSEHVANNFYDAVA